MTSRRDGHRKEQPTALIAFPVFQLLCWKKKITIALQERTTSTSATFWPLSMQHSQTVLGPGTKTRSCLIPAAGNSLCEVQTLQLWKLTQPKEEACAGPLLKNILEPWGEGTLLPRGFPSPPSSFFFWCKSFTSSSHLPSFYPHKGISHSLAYLSHHLFIQHETVCATPFLPPKFLF